MALRTTAAWLGGILAVLCIAGPSYADEARLFGWSWVRLPGAERCPDAEDIAAKVRARLGRDPFAEPVERNLEGWVERVGASWRAQLKVTTLEGQVLGSRELESADESCTMLGEAVTLAVALTINPAASFAAPSERADFPPTSAAPAPIEQASLVPPTTGSAPRLATQEPMPIRAEARQRLALAASLRGLYVLGVLPGPGGGVESGAQLQLSRDFALAVGVGFLPAVLTADRRFGFGLAALALGPCVSLMTTPRAGLGFCGEAQLGSIQAQAFDVQPLPPGEHLWLAARFGLRFTYRVVGPLGFELGALGLVPATRHRFTLRGSDDVLFQARPIGFSGSLALHASIP